MQRNSTNQKQSLEYLQRASGLMQSEWETSRDLASKLIDQAIQLDPNNFQGYLYRARLSYNRYLDIKKAIDDLKVALEIVQNDELLTEEIDIPCLYYDLYFYSIRMTEKISNEILLDYMTKAINAANRIPNYFNNYYYKNFLNKAYYERALLHFQMEMFEEAADDCTLACARVIEGCKYSSIDILNHRARTYFEAGKFRKAIRDFDTLLNDENHKSDFMLYIKRGQSHLALDKHEDAENDFKEAIKINPKTVEGYFNLALLYQTKKNDSLNAMVCYSKTLLLYPKNLQDADKTKEHLDSERKLREIAASGDPAAIYYLMKGILLEDKLQTIKEIQISVPKMGSTLWSLYLHEEIHQALTELEKKTPLTQFSFVANALMASAAEKEKQANDQARLRDFDDHEKASVKNTDVLLGDISTFLGSEEISSRFRKAILEHLLKISPLMTVLFGAAKENWPKINQENCGRKIYEAIGKFIPLSIEQITEVVPSKHSLNI